MNTDKRGRFYLLVFLFSFILLSLVLWIFIQSLFFGSIEKRISRSLPSDSLLRDYKKLEGITPESYLVVYVEKGYEIDESVCTYLSCPGTILGRSIKGEYHLVLYQRGSIVNDVTVQQAYKGYPLELVYQNSKENLYEKGEYLEGQKNELELVDLIKLEDYTGDGKAYEFLFLTTGGGCGFYDGLVAGYNDQRNEAVLYSGWVSRFQPNNQGGFNYLFDCGDHGNMLKIEKKYQFDPETEKYELIWEQETPCDIPL